MLSFASFALFTFFDLLGFLALAFTTYYLRFFIYFHDRYRFNRVSPPLIFLAQPALYYIRVARALLSVLAELVVVFVFRST